MKKFLVFLVLVVLVLFGAQSVDAKWPAEYEGDRVPDGCYAVQSEITDWVDRNPWGQYSPVGVQKIGELCVEGDIARLHFTNFANIYCSETPFSGHVSEACVYKLGIPIDQPEYLLPWNNGSYIVQVVEAKGIEIYSRFHALTFDEETGKAEFVTGAFLYIPPLFYEESTEHTFTRESVKELIAEQLKARVQSRRAR